jgi:ribonuclease-3
MASKSSEQVEPGAAWLAECEQRLGHCFNNKQLLEEALRHASSSGSRLESNERLEFLGDAVLGFTVCELLYDRFPRWLEGELTQVKSVLVSRQMCARLARDLQLGRFLVLGKGTWREETIPKSVLANAFESTIAAIYLDAGMDAAKAFILRLLEKEVDAAAKGDLDRNFKSNFQQWCQRNFGQSPLYELLSQEGPDHSKTFEVRAIVGHRRFPPARGASKKIAEQRAAANALASVLDQAIPYPAESE